MHFMHACTILSRITYRQGLSLILYLAHITSALPILYLGPISKFLHTSLKSTQHASFPPYLKFDIILLLHCLDLYESVS